VIAMRALWLAAACCLPLAAAAAPFNAVVTRITDGDTVWVRPLSGGVPRRVRIEGIDAPEICQAFGTESRDALARHLLNRRVTVLADSRDDYQRTVARLRLGQGDVGLWLVTHGYAWSYRFHGSSGPYEREETRARRKRQGLWAGSAPELPRDFRVRHGSCH
jgi:endonuclease YncB( thermonuclease family)